MFSVAKWARDRKLALGPTTGTGNEKRRTLRKSRFFCIMSFGDHIIRNTKKLPFSRHDVVCSLEMLTVKLQGKCNIFYIMFLFNKINDQTINNEVPTLVTMKRYRKQQLRWWQEEGKWKENKNKNQCFTCTTLCDTFFLAVTARLGCKIF